jgi:hypothetical protein
MKIVSVVIVMFLLVMATCNVKAQTTENIETFLDREIPGIKITVNATAETKPNENITINLHIKPLEEKVEIEYFNFSVFGFINGTYKTLMPLYPNTTGEFALPYECNFTCYVSEQIWGITLGEITLKYNVTYRGQIITIVPYEFSTEFAMTCVENVYLKTVEEQLENLNSILAQLNQTFREYFNTDLTPENFNKTCQELKGSQSELSNTRMTVAVLAITTVFFIATTAYFFIRKPKGYW